MYYPSLRDMRAIIARLNKRHSMDVVIINEGQLKFALEKPKLEMFGQQQYPELYQKAAILMETLTKSHTLSDGNKRTAMMAAEFMIKVNGGELVLPIKSIRFSVDTAMDNDDSMRDMVQQWFKIHTAMDDDELCAMLLEHIEEESILKKLYANMQHEELDNMVSRWMAFDSYPENKRGWEEIYAQWKRQQPVKSSRSGSMQGFEQSQIWKFIADRTRQDHRQYSRNDCTFQVEKTSDLKYNTNSLEELQRLEQTIATYSEKSKSEDEQELLYQNALLLNIHGDTVKSLKIYERLRTIDKDESHAIFHIATILQYEQNDPGAALDYWNIYKNVGGNLRYVDYHVARALYDIGEYDKSLEYCSLHSGEDLHSEEKMLLAGMCHERLGAPRLAISDYLQCASANSLNLDAYGRLIGAHASVGEYEKSLLVADKVIELAPIDFRGYYSKGVVLYQMGNVQEAVKAYEKALVLNPHDARTIINMGSTMSDMGRHLDAVQYFQKALDMEPKNPTALYNMSFTLVLLGKYDDAISFVNALLESDPGNSMAKCCKAAILANTGQILASLDLLEEAYKSNPESTADWIKDGLFGPITESERFKKLAHDVEGRGK